jgi:hypothetical protein
MKAVSIQNHDMWGKALPSNILKENFGPTHCSTPKIILKTGLKALGAVTPSTQLVLASLVKTPILGLSNAKPAQRSFEECGGKRENKTDVKSIHAFETTTSILTADQQQQQHCVLELN